MNKLRKQREKNLRIIIIMLLIPFVICGVFYFGELRINDSLSLPVGIWRVAAGTDENIRRGDFVVFMAQDFFRDKSLGDVYPKRDKSRTYMKKVSGIAGDEIVYDEKMGVLVNGRAEQNTIIISRDIKTGKQITHIKYPVIVQADEYWLTSNHPGGFDSRYYGAVHKKYIVERVYPVWTTE